MQHLQDGRDGLRHAVVRPRDVMQLFQSSATLEKMKSVFNCNAKTLSKTLDNVVMSQKPVMTLTCRWEQYSHFYKSPVTSLSDNPLYFPQNPVGGKTIRFKTDNKHKKKNQEMADKNTHTVDGKRLTNKRLLLFLWPVTLAFPLMKKHLHTNLKTQTEMCIKTQTKMKENCHTNCRITGEK